MATKYAIRGLVDKLPTDDELLQYIATILNWRDINLLGLERLNDRMEFVEARDFVLCRILYDPSAAKYYCVDRDEDTFTQVTGATEIRPEMLRRKLYFGEWQPKLLTFLQLFGRRIHAREGVLCDAVFEAVNPSMQPAGEPVAESASEGTQSTELQFPQELIAKLKKSPDSHRVMREVVATALNNEMLQQALLAIDITRSEISAYDHQAFYRGELSLKDLMMFVKSTVVYSRGDEVYAVRDLAGHALAVDENSNVVIRPQYIFKRETGDRLKSSLGTFVRVKELGTTIELFVLVHTMKKMGVIAMNNIVFQPLRPSMSKNFHQPVLNTYVPPFRFRQELLDNASTDEIQPILDHLMYMCNDDPRLFKWYLNWQAQLVQRPWQKTRTVPVFIGPKGCGKSMFWQFFRHVVGFHNTLGCSLSQMFEDQHFNGSNAILVVVDEMEQFAMRRERTREKFKTKVTCDVEFIRPHYSAGKDVTYFTNIVCLSNNDYCLCPMEDEHPRRPMVCKILDQRGLAASLSTRGGSRGRQYFEKLSDMISYGQNPTNTMYYAEKYYYYLMSLPLNGNQGNYVTPALMNMIQHGQPEIKRLLTFLALHEGEPLSNDGTGLGIGIGDSPVKVDSATLYDIYTSDAYPNRREGRHLIQSATKMTYELNALQFRYTRPQNRYVYCLDRQTIIEKCGNPIMLDALRLKQMLWRMVENDSLHSIYAVSELYDEYCRQNPDETGRHFANAEDFEQALRSMWPLQEELMRTGMFNVNENLRDFVHHYN